MFRLGTLFIVGCAVIIGTSASIATMIIFKWSLTQGAFVGVASVLAVTIAHLVIMFDRDTHARTSHIHNVQQDIEILSDRMALLDLRITRAETIPVVALKRGFAPIAEEMTELGTLVHQLAEQVKEHEETLASQVRALPIPALWPTLSTPPVSITHATSDNFSAFNAAHTGTLHQHAAAEPSEPAPFAAPKREYKKTTTASATPKPDMSSLPLVLKALEDGQLDVHLQPIVQLPQRRVVHYEAMARLRNADDSLIMPDEFLPVAREAQISAALDALTMDRVLRIARRLKSHNRSTALFVNVDADTLIDPDFATDLAIRLDANSDLAEHIILEIAYDSVTNLTGTAEGVLMTLADKGFSLSLDVRLIPDIDAAKLYELGFRYIKIPTTAFHDPVFAARSSIHPNDIPALFKRHGITTIVTQIEEEDQVAHILDFDITMAQGFLFGAARPVRAEVFAETSPSKRATIRGTDGIPVRAMDRFPNAAVNTGIRRGIGSIARRA